MRSQNLKRKKGSLHDNDDTGRREETFMTVQRSSFSQTKRALEPVKEESHEAKEIATSPVRQWMNQTEEEDEDEEEDEQQRSETKHEPNEEKKELLMGATTYQEGKKVLNRWKLEAFKRLRIWATVVDRSKIRRFSGRMRKRRKWKWEERRTPSFSREVGGGGVTTMTTVAKLSFTHLSRLSDSYAPDVPTPLLLRLIALHERVKDTANSIFRAGSHSFSFPTNLLPVPICHGRLRSELR